MDNMKKWLALFESAAADLLRVINSRQGVRLDAEHLIREYPFSDAVRTFKSWHCPECADADVEQALRDFVELSHDLVIREGEGTLDVRTPGVEAIASKHGVSVDQINAQLDKGIRVEMEHTTDEATAREIALDHLNELPDYYDRLEVVEEADDTPRSNVDIAVDLEDIAAQILDLVDEAERLIRPTGEYERAKAYWLAHIRSAVDSDQFGYGQSYNDMKSTIDTLRDSG